MLLIFVYVRCLKPEINQNNLIVSHSEILSLDVSVYMTTAMKLFNWVEHLQSHFLDLFEIPPTLILLNVLHHWLCQVFSDEIASSIDSVVQHVLYALRQIVLFEEEALSQDHAWPHLLKVELDRNILFLLGVLIQAHHSLAAFRDVAGELEAIEP